MKGKPEATGEDTENTKEVVTIVEARASWNTVYLNKNGFECQLTLRDSDETSLMERVSKAIVQIVDAGGTPVRRRWNGGVANDHPNEDGAAPSGDQPAREKTYVDQKGVRRCNLTTRGGRRCAQPVTEKEGRYGLFWSCPNYKEHAPVGA